MDLHRRKHAFLCHRLTLLLSHQHSRHHQHPRAHRPHRLCLSPLHLLLLLLLLNPHLHRLYPLTHLEYPHSAHSAQYCLVSAALYSGWLVLTVEVDKEKCIPLKHSSCSPKFNRVQVMQSVHCCILREWTMVLIVWIHPVV